jgi:hypothetical protein
MSVFWDAAPYSPVDNDRRFRAAYCFHHQDNLMMEAVSCSEKFVNIYQSTRHNIPEDRYLHTRRLRT